MAKTKTTTNIEAEEEASQVSCEITQTEDGRTFNNGDEIVSPN